MNLDSPALLTIGYVFAGFIITAVLFFMRRGASRRVTKLAQATQDLQANLEEFRNETNRRVVELENTVDQLKVECAVANVRLSSAEAQKGATTAKLAASTHEDSWIRSENLIDFPIVPTIPESLDNDTWVRNESEPNDDEPMNSAALLATAFSQGNATGNSFVRESSVRKSRR